MAIHHITLEQWRALIAVVDAGGYAQAAEALNKSQSAVTYAVQKLQSVLGVKAFEVQGRKAVLTPTGQLLYRRARALLDDAGGLENAARKLSAGWEAEIRVVMEIGVSHVADAEVPGPLRRGEPAHAYRADRIRAGRNAGSCFSRGRPISQ